MTTCATPTAPKLPPPPAARVGFIVELGIRGGRPVWRQRRLDHADAAYWSWKQDGGAFPADRNEGKGV